MNYFELFNIPVALKVDKSGLAKQYFELQKKYHPDFFVQADSGERDTVLEISSAINKAFKIFQNNDETIKYVLQQKGLVKEEEKFELPPDFLMEMMDYNEELMDAKLEENKEKIEQISNRLAATQNEIYEPVKEIIENYKDGVSAEKELLQVKEYYYKKKYLNRILAGIN